MECLREDLLTHEELQAQVAGAPGVVCAYEAHVVERLRELEPLYRRRAGGCRCVCSGVCSIHGEGLCRCWRRWMRTICAAPMRRCWRSSALHRQQDKMSKLIRRAVASDVDALLALEHSVTEAAHWSTAEYLQILHPESQEAPLQRRVFIAEESGAPAWIHRGEAAAHRGRGAGGDREPGGIAEGPAAGVRAPRSVRRHWRPAGRRERRWPSLRCGQEIARRSGSILALDSSRRAFARATMRIRRKTPFFCEFQWNNGKKSPVTTRHSDTI